MRLPKKLQNLTKIMCKLYTNIVLIETGEFSLSDVITIMLLKENILIALQNYLNYGRF